MKYSILLAVSSVAAFHLNAGAQGIFSKRDVPIAARTLAKRQAAATRGNDSGENGLGNNANGDLNGQAFCEQFSDLALSDGSQNRAGACSLTVQGAIPSFDNMVSTLIVQPAAGSTVDGSQDMTVVIDIS